jgi:hypothetical protein
MSNVVYFVRFPSGLVKIGQTSQMRHRMAVYRTSEGAIRIIAVVRGGLDVEKAMHTAFAAYRAPAKRRGPDLFDLSAELVAAVEATFKAATEEYLTEQRCDRGFCKLRRSRSPFAGQVEATA